MHIFTPLTRIVDILRTCGQRNQITVDVAALNTLVIPDWITSYITLAILALRTNELIG